MFKTLITFGFGFYCGVYTAQNHEIPKVADPEELYRRFLKFLEDTSKKKD